MCVAQMSSGRRKIYFLMRLRFEECVEDALDQIAKLQQIAFFIQGVDKNDSIWLGVGRFAVRDLFEQTGFSDAIHALNDDNFILTDPILDLLQFAFTPDKTSRLGRRLRR